MPVIDVEVARAWAKERWPSPVVRRQIDDLLTNCPRATEQTVEGEPTVEKKRMIALQFLYDQLRKAKISLGNAEQRQNNQKERDNLQKKIETIDWIICIVWRARV